MSQVEARAARPSVSSLAGQLLAEHPEEAARIIETAKDPDTAALIQRIPTGVAAELLRHLTPDRAARVVGALGEETLRSVVGAMDPSRVAGLLKRLDATERERCLAALRPADADELRELTAYPADTAGALMDPRATTFPPDTPVENVLRRLRRFRNKSIQDIFLVGPDDALVGAVSMQDLVLAEPDTVVSTLSKGPPVTVRDVDSRDVVVEVFQAHRVTSLPVVGFNGEIKGVLHQRAVVRAAAQDAAASAVTMVGAGEDERALSTVGFTIRKRLPWLQVNLLTAFIAASVVGLFEATIAQVTALAVLLPVVAGQSGNTGAQALAVTMRGLALREIRVRDWLRVVRKEAAAGAGNGVAVALTTSIAVYFWSGSTGLAAVIGISMVISMTLAGMSGALIPVALTAAKQDPAQSSSIVLTTVTDVVGFFSFLGIASVLSSYL